MKCERVVQRAANDSLELPLPKTARMAIPGVDGSVVTYFQPRLMILLPLTKTRLPAGSTPESVEDDLCCTARKVFIDVNQSITEALIQARKDRLLMREDRTSKLNSRVGERFRLFDPLVP